MNQIKKVIIKGSDLDRLYEAFDEMKDNERAMLYTPSILELQKMVIQLDKYAIFLLWINETGEVNEENEDQHSIIEQIIKQYVIIDNES